MSKCEDSKKIQILFKRILARWKTGKRVLLASCKKQIFAKIENSETKRKKTLATLEFSKFAIHKLGNSIKFSYF